MTTRRETYTSDRVLESFYADLIRLANAKRPDKIIAKLHIPQSDVFYVRNMIRDATGENYSLGYVEWAMMKEGFLDPSDCFEGDERVLWEEYKDEKLSTERKIGNENESI